MAYKPIDVMSHSHEIAARIISDSLAANPLLPALDNTYGALMIGTAFGLMFVTRHVSRCLQVLKTRLTSYRIYGMTVLQTYRYFRLYPDDRPIITWMVRRRRLLT